MVHYVVKIYYFDFVVKDYLNNETHVTSKELLSKCMDYNIECTSGYLSCCNAFIISITIMWFSFPNLCIQLASMTKVS